MNRLSPLSVRSRILGFVLFGATALGITAGVGCAKSDSTTRHSARGEECSTTSDCNDGLSCVPRAGAGGGVCVQGDFKVSPTAKECAVIQCSQATDCCPTPPASCASEQQSCNQGVTSACDYVNRYCKCDGSKWSCDNGSCKSQCSTTADCAVGTCMGGQCVQCTDDAQCTNGNVCNNNLCTPPCKSDTDCSSFNRCTDGKCVASGCETDRECIAATKNVTAVCKSNACLVPCQTDLECGNPQDYHFYSCIKNQCIYVGCQTDKECQLYLGTTGTTQHGQIVCRDKQK